MFAHSNHKEARNIRNKIERNKNTPHIMGLIDVFAKFHGKPKWSELEPWHKLLIGIELMMLPLTLIVLVEMLDGLL
jgi:hypothetical protein